MSVVWRSLSVRICSCINDVILLSISTLTSTVFDCCTMRREIIAGATGMSKSQRRLGCVARLAACLAFLASWLSVSMLRGHDETQTHNVRD